MKSDRGKLVIDKFQLKALVNAYLEKQIDDVGLAYISDAILLHENTVYESEAIYDCLGEMTDPKVNGPMTIERMKAIEGLLDSI